MILRKICTIVTGTAIALTLVACDNSQQASTPVKETKQSAPMTEKSENKTSQYVVQGKIVETKDAASYTYLLLDDGDGNQMWAAIPKTKLTVGEMVTLENGTVMTNFKSKAFDKVFETIVFASGIAKDETVKKVEDNEKYQVEPGSGGSEGNTMALADIKVDKAAGNDAYTVVELFASPSTFDKKNVSVKGKVVKVSNQIMGKNWLHIQDGTGDPAKRTHDLVVTTAGTIDVGTVVTIKGVAAANKDFGYGYKYDILVEDATITK